MQEDRPGCVAVADADPAAMGLDDPPGDGHAQAGPLGLGGEERVEDSGSPVGRDTRSVVAEGDADRRLVLEPDLLGADLNGDR